MLTMTWYANKQILIFQGNPGDKLREQIIDFITNIDDKSDDQESENISSNSFINDGVRDCVCLSSDVGEVKQSVKHLHEAINIDIICLLSGNVTKLDSTTKSTRGIGIHNLTG
jgi:hypothetical protein